MKLIRSIICLLLCAFMCSGYAASTAIAFTYQQPDGTLTFEKITHPDKPVAEADGIVDYVGNGVVSAEDLGQGARGQSYSWCAAGRGDYVYIGTCYGAATNTLDLMSDVLGGNFDQETLVATLNVLYNGTFFTGEEDGANPGGILAKVNTVTNEVTILMSKSTDGHNPLFRNATAYNGRFYFCGSVDGLPCIYELDPETDELVMVYQGMTLQDFYEGYLEGICTGIRGLCEFDGELILSCVTKDGPVILSSSEPREGFTVIADQHDLFDYPAYHFCDSIYGGSIWEMTEFNGSLYVSICTGTPENMPDDNTMQSFALVRGDKDENGEWIWTSIIGDQERDGARYTFGIDPERTRSGAGVIQVYNGYLYIGEYNDEEVALEDLLLETSFDFFNENLRQSVNLYRMDADENIELVVGDPTEMFPDGGISGIGSGFGRNENQYIWRMTEYEGKLYLGTFDTSSLLEPIGQFANGDINNMTPEEWERLIGFIRILIELRLSGGGDEGSEGSDTAPMDKLFADYDDETLAYVLRTGDISVLGIGTRCADLDPDMVRAYMLNETDTLPIGDISDLIELLGGLNGLMDTVRGTLTCAGYLADATRGFDMYVSEDGINFETITIDGFGDPYNHGLRVFAETDSGLTIGTANPFFGTQVWLMNEEESGDEHTVTFVDGVTGDTLGSAVIADGLTVGEELFPEAPEHDGYEFIGWDYDGSEVYSDLTITALYREVSGPMLGDVNEDGVIDTTDAVLALRCALMLIELEKPELADINGDGIVSIIDALAIIRIAMNIA
ncbi:MAG: dockerin type I repeat-containing protein [Clostridiales bacterium]|nr:dockerin type I repeat-containing protein [Clostridiales bacterium]